MTTVYHLGYSRLAELRPLARCDAERFALQRLDGFQGSEADMRVAAGIYARGGATKDADDLLLFAGLRPSPKRRKLCVGRHRAD